MSIVFGKNKGQLITGRFHQCLHRLIIECPRRQLQCSVTGRRPGVLPSICCHWMLPCRCKKKKKNAGSTQHTSVVHRGSIVSLPHHKRQNGSVHTRHARATLCLHRVIHGRRSPGVSAEKAIQSLVSVHPCTLATPWRSYHP